MIEESKIQIEFLPAGVVCEVKPGQSVLDVAMEHNVKLNHSCGGNGTCTTCRVIVLEGADTLPERNEVEIDIIKGRGFNKNERLGCQLVPTTNIKVEIPS